MQTERAYSAGYIGVIYETRGEAFWEWPSAIGEFSISSEHDVLRYLIKAEARGDKDGRARHRLTNKNILSTIAMLYRAVRECRA